MRKITMILFFLSGFILAQNAWINEFHYDNAGSPDVGEFVEVAIENASSYNLDDFRISFYSSTSGTRYGVYHQLSSFDVGITDNNITLYSKMIASIQNGPNDGIALDYQGTVLQLISYEGTLTASEGVANGLTSVDVGVFESNDTPIGSSIGLNGIGTNYSNFTWIVLSDDTPGQVNGNQALPVELTTFSAAINDNNIELLWETATEVNNYGFEVEKQNSEDRIQNSEWEKIGFVEGSGNSNSPKMYSFTDQVFNNNGFTYYRLKQIDIDGSYELSDVVEVSSILPQDYELLQNYPNPFNPSTTIQFEIPIDSQVKLSVFNILGENVAILIDGNISAGFHNIKFDAKDINTGVYFYKLESKDFSKIRKMMLIK